MLLNAAQCCSMLLCCSLPLLLLLQVSEAELAVSTLYAGPNLSPGWQLTELRMWADARGSTDLESQVHIYRH